MMTTEGEISMTFDPCPALHAAVKEGDVETAAQLLEDDGACPPQEAAQIS